MSNEYRDWQSEEIKTLRAELSTLKAQNEALVEAVDRYHNAVIRRNTTPYPEPDERVEIAMELDESQAEMFGALAECQKEGEPCEKCGAFVAGFKYEGCCSGHECGCMGKPVEPCLCNDCWAALVEGKQDG